MSLLEEGIATGNVLPTGRKEKHSIDNVTRDFDIYRIKCDLLFYNDQNDRIATWVSEYNSAQGADLLALGRDEYNASSRTSSSRATPARSGRPRRASPFAASLGRASCSTTDASSTATDA